MPESIALAQLKGLLEHGAQLVYVLPPDGALRRARPGDRLGVARSDPDRRSIDRGRCADGGGVGATPPHPRRRHLSFASAMRPASRWQSVRVICHRQMRSPGPLRHATINRVVTFLPRNTSRAPMDEDAARRLPVLGRAPELVGVDPWFNTPDGEPLRLAALQGSVVLLEFWTLACVNCQRTLPFPTSDARSVPARLHGRRRPH